MKLIIQIPCYNEEKTLPVTLRDLPKKIRGIDEIEILVINDGSEDSTVEVAKKAGVSHILDLPLRSGLAEAFRRGIERSLELGADIVVNTDGDKFKEVINKNKDNLTYPLLYDEIMKIYLDKENWGEKTNLKWRATKSVLDMFDDIYIIHVIRDPRDVLVSWKGYTIAPGNDYLDGISNLYDSMKTALENQKAFPERYYVLKYEDLVSDPEKEVKKLCDFLGLTFDEKMLDTKNFRSKKGGIWDPNKHTKFSDKLEKISAKPVGRWKEKLSKEDLLLTEFVIMDLMKEFGYEPSNTKWSAMDVRNAFANLLKSSLATEGIMDILKNKGGKERPPLDSSNWRETVQ